jgi:gas vesicle protein
MREDWVQRAVEFVRHQSVKDATEAAQFLRAKGYSEEELDEVWRRAGDKFGTASKPPRPLSPPAAGVTEGLEASPMRWQSERTGSRTWNWAWRLTLAISAISLLREFLRKYVVPIYYPQQSRPTRKPASEASVLRKELRQLRQSIESLSTVIRSMSDQVQQHWRDTQDQLRELRTELRYARPVKSGPAASSLTERPTTASTQEAFGSQSLPANGLDEGATSWSLPDFDSIEPADSTR